MFRLHYTLYLAAGYSSLLCFYHLPSCGPLPTSCRGAAHLAVQRPLLRATPIRPRCLKRAGHNITLITQDIGEVTWTNHTKSFAKPPIIKVIQLIREKLYFQNSTSTGKFRKTGSTLRPGPSSGHSHNLGTPDRFRCDAHSRHLGRGQT